MTIKQLRTEKNITQKRASEITGIPLRTFKTYETDPAKIGTIKYEYICESLRRYGFIDESHGILSLETIRSKCEQIFKDHPVDYCILFGSYARGTANETSDIDLLVSTSLSGLAYFGLIETLRSNLHKKIDMLDIDQLNDNPELLNNILKEGIRIYVQK